MVWAFENDRGGLPNLCVAPGLTCLREETKADRPVTFLWLEGEKRFLTKKRQARDRESLQKPELRNVGHLPIEMPDQDPGLSQLPLSLARPIC